MISIRAKFFRGEEVKYISHLDMMKVFERTIRRSGIPIMYSQGFNPHPHMVFGLPLSVGVTSEAEYADFEFTEQIGAEEFIEKMNSSFPLGFKIIDAAYKQSKSNIMASINAASYGVLVCTQKIIDIKLIKDKIDGFMQLPSIIVKKEGKSGIKDVNIKPMIYAIEAKILEGSGAEELQSLEGIERASLYCTNTSLVRYAEDVKKSGIGLSYDPENIFCLSVLVSAGSAANLKPELLISAINEMTDLNLKLVKVHRTGLFIQGEADLINPLNDRVLSGL